MAQSWRTRLSRCSLILVLLAGLVVPAWSAPIAQAHAEFVSSVPEAGSFLSVAPTEVSIVFSGPIRAEGSALSVIAPGGSEVNAARLQVGSDGKSLVVPLRAGIPNGLYQVNWVAMTADGDEEEGSFNFGLRVGAAPPTIRLSRSTAGVGTTIDITGAGFKANGAVVASICADNEFVGYTRADAQGNVATTIMIPDDVPYGWQTVTLADGDGAFATQTVLVNPGGGTPIKVRLETNVSHRAPDDLGFVVTILNRSAYNLRLDTVTMALPSGTRLKSATNGGQLIDGKIVWSNISLSASQGLEPLTAVLDTSALPDNSPVSGQALVTYRQVEDRMAGATATTASVNGSVASPVATTTSGGVGH